MSEVNPAGLEKRRNGNSYRIRRWYKLPGLAPPTKLGVYNNNLDNGYRAFAERYFTCKTERGFEPALTVEPDAFIGDPDLMAFLNMVVSRLELAPVATTMDVVNAYTGPKRATYMRAREELHRDGVMTRHAHLHSMIKKEKQNLDGAPRVINPRDPVFNLALGRYLKLNEKEYYKAIASVFGQTHTVIKGLDIQQSGAEISGLWNMFGNTVAVGGDASKFDMHVSREALEFEHLFYLLPYFDGDASECLAAYRAVQGEGLKTCPEDTHFHELAWLLSKQLDNQGTAYFDDGKLLFKMRGTRASGDLNTSLGNCLIMCAISYAWSQRAGTRVALANNGDDCVSFLEREDLEHWLCGQVEYYRAKGFRMVMEEPVHVIEGVEFCQSKPVLVDGQWTMVRNPMTNVIKSSMCLQPVGTMKGLRKWMTSVGICEGHLASGVPVMGAFARAMRRNGLRCSKRMVERMQGQTSRTTSREFIYNEPTEETRLSFCSAWGITPQEQRLLESHYDEWTLGTTFGQTVLGDGAMEKAEEPLAPITLLVCPVN